MSRLSTRLPYPSHAGRWARSETGEIVQQSHIPPWQHQLSWADHCLDANVDTATAYTIDEDKEAKYKNKSFVQIVPERLKQVKYDTLVLQGGCNEVSKIKSSF